MNSNASTTTPRMNHEGEASPKQGGYEDSGELDVAYAAAWHFIIWRVLAAATAPVSQ